MTTRLTDEMFTPQVVRAPTSADVAQAAGVSRATVSLVLNERPGARISPDTRRRVREAAALLGYTPNTAAQSLAGGPGTSLMIAAPAVTDFGTAVTRALSLAIRDVADNGNEVLRDDGTERSTEAAQRWARHRPRSVLAGADRCDPAATEVLRQAGVRALLVYGTTQVEHAPSLVVPQRDYGRLAARVLVEAGHRHLAFVGPDTPDLADVRFEAAAEVARGAGATLARVSGATSSAAMRDWATGGRYQDDPPTGIVAFDDAHAIAVIRALADAGVRVPAEVSVVGGDDHPLSSEYAPRITSVAFSPEALAARIVCAFRTMLDGGTVERVDVPAFAVIRRESVAGR